MKIVVLAGGYSTERDVSLASGAQIANTLIAKGHEVLLLDLYVGEQNYDNFADAYQNLKQTQYTFEIPTVEPDLAALKAKQAGQIALVGPNILEICQTADCTFLGLHGGIGENGKLQALFDIYGITYTGSSYSSSLLAMDKILSKQLMTFHNILTPQWSEVTAEDDLTAIQVPCVVKPIDGGSSIGVELVDTKEELTASIQRVSKYSKQILIEEKVIGREFSVGVLGEQVLPPIEIVTNAEFFDYQSKYQADAATEICPADISQELTTEMQEITFKLYKQLGLSVYARVDFIVDENDRIYCIEVNTLPGMTPCSLLPKEAQAAGIDYPSLCEKIIQLSVQGK
ncbi:D-alanine-D-alanine ligase [Enterococcus sp. PF1-24]|uniref:D-alanine--D-alanine ligase family protein n=1 Tax=unclassified Enterococcus TaxID=2608891 RepID=UPI002474D4DE|nr:MULTISPECIES: D-alanine--D-alanine ligase [unclassified Enterococcus]MDH6364126.1 D-alanine-D-alanine ligase [Enterococcus sp. PFB1-1]MDH6401227.1 D-alanine-D-alanine ligase [Enterococcus sp. PF1-24]